MREKGREAERERDKVLASGKWNWKKRQLEMGCVFTSYLDTFVSL